jgi:hypothetical protein
LSQIRQGCDPAEAGDPRTLSAWDIIPKYQIRRKTYDREEEVYNEERKEFLVQLAAEKIKRRSGTV